MLNFFIIACTQVQYVEFHEGCYVCPSLSIILCMIIEVNIKFDMFGMFHWLQGFVIIPHPHCTYSNAWTSFRAPSFYLLKVILILEWKEQNYFSHFVMNCSKQLHFRHLPFTRRYCYEYWLPSIIILIHCSSSLCIFANKGDSSMAFKSLFILGMSNPKWLIINNYEDKDFCSHKLHPITTFEIHQIWGFLWNNIQ